MSRRKRAEPDPRVLLWADRERYAGYIKERWPDLVSLRFVLEFGNYSWKDTAKKELTWGPEHRAFFWITCPWQHYKIGWFDLNDPVSRMLHDRQKNIEGEARCTGQAVPGHGATECHCNLRYKVFASYRGVGKDGPGGMTPDGDLGPPTPVASMIRTPARDD